MRKFELISKEQWEKDVLNEEYPTINLKPQRGTKYSAGYDFISPISFTIPPNGTYKVPTCIKVLMNGDEALTIYPRSSIGFKTNIRLSNTLGIVDADYYNNQNNEGHIFIKFYNPTENEYKIEKGDKIAQGIFTKYLTTDDEEIIITERVGGFGSTGA